MENSEDPDWLADLDLHHFLKRIFPYSTGQVLMIQHS